MLNQLERNPRFQSLSVVLNAISISSERNYGYGKYGFDYYEESEGEKRSFMERLKSLAGKN